MSNYDNYYKTENLFGKPLDSLVEFFDNYPKKGKLLDLGCGQGRDALALAKLGYEVTGIDNSKIGIDQLLKASKAEGLNIKAFTDDIFKYENFSDFDIVLLDSMFHFLKQDLKKEQGLLQNIGNKIKIRSIICVCIQDTGSKVKTLKETFQDSDKYFEIIFDTTSMYKFEDNTSGHKSETKYRICIFKKNS